jgi:predicted ATP-grasp superfamily ATP-dependent carboligase
MTEASEKHRSTIHAIDLRAGFLGLKDLSMASAASVPPDKVIVAGCRHGGLAVIRALGPLGLHIIALTHQPRDFGTASRYVREVAICPHPENREAFSGFLVRRASEWGGALILDTDDYYTTALSSSKRQLEQYYAVLAPDWAVTQRFIDKDQSYRVADACGVPRPSMYAPHTMAELESELGLYRFPMMIKPVRSHEFVAHFGKKLFIVHSPAEMRTRFQEVLNAKLPVLVQEIIPGTDYGTLESAEIYIDSQGELRAELYNIKLRQSPPMYGVMCAGKSVPPIQDVREYALRLLREVGYRGFASIEFKRDVRDGLPKLIEVNVRLPRNGQLLYASGINFPHLIYQDLVLGQRAGTHRYEPTYFVDLIPDIGNLLMRNARMLLHLPTVLRPYVARRRTFAVCSWKDPRPFVSLVTAKVTRRRRSHGVTPPKS